MSWVAVAIGGSAVLGAYSANKAGKAGQAGAQAGVDSQERMYNQMRGDLMPWQQSGGLALSQLMERMGLATPQSSRGGNAPQRPTREQFTTQTAGSGGRWGGRSGETFIHGQPGSTNFDQAGYDQAMSQYDQQMAADQNASQQNPDNFGDLMQPFTQDQFLESPGYQFNLDQGMQALRKGAAANSGTTYAPQTLRDMGRFAQNTAKNEWGAERDAYNSERGFQYGMLSGQSGAGQSAANQTGLAGVATGQGVAESQAQGANARAAGYMGVNNAVQSGIGNAYTQYLQKSIIDNQKPTYGQPTTSYNRTPA